MHIEEKETDIFNKNNHHNANIHRGAELENYSQGANLIITLQIHWGPITKIKIFYKNYTIVFFARWARAHHAPLVSPPLHPWMSP